MTFDEMPTAVRLPFWLLIYCLYGRQLYIFTFSKCLKRRIEREKKISSESYRNKKWIIGCEIYCQTFAHLIFSLKIASLATKKFLSHFRNIKMRGIEKIFGERSKAKFEAREMPLN
jgi:hypothetical protein